MKDILKIVGGGAAIGIAEVIPGVSGGTIAVMMNLYDRLIGSIGNLRKDFKNSIRFLIPLLLGMGAAIVAFSHLLKYLLATYPMVMNSLFLGLIIGIVPMLCRRASCASPRAYHYIPLVVTFLIMMALSTFGGTDTAQVYTQLTVPLAFKLAGCGFVAALCMIIPGISGSMMMVIFGMYGTVIGSITDLFRQPLSSIPILACAGIGMLAGVVLGAKFIGYCLAHFPQATYYGILGLVLGSSFSLFAKAGLSLASAEGFVSLAAIAVGIALSLFFTSDKSIGATEK